jgi:hypothetical protein
MFKGFAGKPVGQGGYGRYLQAFFLEMLLFRVNKEAFE